MEREPYPRWHIGSNMPGYMPNDDPYCMVGSEEDAKHAAKEEAERILDECDRTEECPDPATHHGPGAFECTCRVGTCQVISCADHASHDCQHTECCDQHDEPLDDSGDYWIHCDPAGCHVWYAQCDTPEECEESDHRQHDCGGPGECSICDADEEI